VLGIRIPVYAANSTHASRTPARRAVADTGHRRAAVDTWVTGDTTDAVGALGTVGGREAG